jgi:hypothetical protein
VTHASVNLGIIICARCALSHFNFGNRISAVKAFGETWTTRDLKILAAGGNSSLKVFLTMYNIKLQERNKYKTVACQYYRELLLMMAEGVSVSMSAPSIEEGSVIIDEKSRRKSVALGKGLSSSLSIFKPIKENLNFLKIQDLTSDAFELITQGTKWGADKCREGFEWSAEQGKRLIRRMSNKESFIIEAEKVYSQIQVHLCIAPRREEALQMIRDLEIDNVL